LTVTLWNIADDSTVTLMKSYYQRLKDRDAGKIQISTLDALRQAKLEMIEGETYSHPFYWAPFILMGEWR
jgi:CHAT domain-containing protein